MAATIGALGHDHVSTGRRRFDRVGGGGHHVYDLDSAVMGRIEDRFQILIVTRPCSRINSRLGVENGADLVVFGKR